GMLDYSSRFEGGQMPVGEVVPVGRDVPAASCYRAKVSGRSTVPLAQTDGTLAMANRSWFLVPGRSDACPSTAITRLRSRLLAGRWSIGGCVLGRRASRGAGVGGEDPPRRRGGRPDRAPAVPPGSRGRAGRAPPAIGSVHPGRDSPGTTIPHRDGAVA